MDRAVLAFAYAAVGIILLFGVNLPVAVFMIGLTLSRLIYLLLTLGAKGE